jgi:putative Ca2+/H+ antiporter (TMEM165/GDT1 family)
VKTGRLFHGIDELPQQFGRTMYRTFLTVFATVFIAEIGDKTQLATMLFASEEKASPWVIFAGSALALTLAAAIGVVAGSQISRFVSPATLKIIAGIGFILIGTWTLFSR